MANMLKSILLASAFSLFIPSMVFSQKEEDFERLARRAIDDYEKVVKAHQKDYDFAVWHGAGYIGVSSRGHILPNGFFNYKKGKVRMSGELEMDIADMTTSRSEEGNYASGDYQYMETNIQNRYEHERIDFRIDYLLDKQNTLSLDLFQKYHSDRVGETATLYKVPADPEAEAIVKYEFQKRDKTDFNCGSLLEYLHDFKDGGSLSARAYVKYDNTPIDIYKEVWGQGVDYDDNTDRQSTNSKDIKGQVIYLSPKWKGFNFGVREKVGKINTGISDALTRFEYDVIQTLTSGSINYGIGNFSFVLQGGFETYNHDLETSNNTAEKAIKHTYRDWIYNAKATWKVDKRNTIVVSFDHDILRPTYTQLYPFIHVGSNIGSRVIGNENLEPAVTNEIKAKYTYKVKPLTLNTSLTYQKKMDDITSIAIYDEASKMNVKTWVNDAEYNILKAALEGEVRSGIFDMTFGARAQRLWYEGEHVKTDKAWSYSFKIRPQVHLPNEWLLSAVAQYNGREEHRYWYHEAFTYLALRAQKQIGDWAVYCFLQDILNENRVKNEYSKGNSIRTSNDFNARALVLGCSYRF